MSRALTPAEVIVNRILIVDEQRSDAEQLKSVLEKHRYTVELAKDSGQAHVAFTMHLPDLVITDVIFSNNVSGFEIAERMKQQNPHVPVIMLTPIDMDDARDLAARVGVDLYLNKPCDPQELLSQIVVVAEEAWRRKHHASDTDNSEKVRFACGECGKHLKVKASNRGRTLNCPRCGQTVIVPVHD